MIFTEVVRWQVADWHVKLNNLEIASKAPPLIDIPRGRESLLNRPPSRLVKLAALGANTVAPNDSHHVHRYERHGD